MAPFVTGRRILRAEFSSRFVVTGSFDDLSAKLEGRTIHGISRRAKFILLDLGEGFLSIHLGMTGRLLIDARPQPHTYGFFELDRGTLAFIDPRQFGKIEWSPERVTRLGPEPLSIPFDEFFARLKARHARIKPLLLNQAFLGGLGNIYADEALHRAGIHPKALASRISAPRARKLHQAIQQILSDAIEHRGSSISDYVDAEGERGEFQQLHGVYGREGEPCLQCGSTVRRIVLGGRGTHYCPKCQR